jgi:aminoglycoside phosphotransferase family enzyme/predicted kinase
LSEVHDWLAARAERVIETSCAWVFLEGQRALKVKQPVDFGFLDFSTLQKRHWALERELRFNRATAPDIYRAVRRITRGAVGLEVDGAGETLEYALEMRRFDPDAVLSQRPDAVDPTMAETLGRMIARFHAGAETRPEGGGVKALGYTIGVNAEHMRMMAGVLGASAAEQLIAAIDAAFAIQAPLLERRRAEGFGRRCHGDLHLGNILLEDGEPKLFDCIEFNDLLSDIDVQYDVAFLIMDLWFRRRLAAANRVLNAYLDETSRSFAASLWDGLTALPLMLAVRASVRAHVTANQAEPAAARAYLAAAAEHLAPPSPQLIAIGGVSGTGKTTLARRIAPEIGAAPGAVLLRSDEIRKRLAGARPTERLPGSAYAADWNARVYAEMFALAARCLAAGRAAMLDAVFLRADERAAAKAVAAAAGVPWRPIWLQGEPAQLKARLAARRGDASDAGVAVLEQQLALDPGPIDWQIGDAADLEGVAAGMLRNAQPN